MTKNELIALLTNIEGNPKVVMSQDEEGNSFHEVYEYAIEDDQDSDLCYEFGVPVIVLWP
jgi:hypothetical protein